MVGRQTLNLIMEGSIPPGAAMSRRYPGLSGCGGKVDAGALKSPASWHAGSIPVARTKARVV